MFSLNFNLSLFAWTVLMTFSQANLKGNVYKVSFFSAYSEQEMYTTNVSLSGVYCRFHLKFSLTWVVTWGYQTEWEYYTQPPSYFKSINSWCTFPRCPHFFLSTRYSRNAHYAIRIARFFLRWEIFQTQVVERVKTHIFYSITSLPPQKWCRLWDNM